MQINVPLNYTRIYAVESQLCLNKGFMQFNG